MRTSGVLCALAMSAMARRRKRAASEPYGAMMSLREATLSSPLSDRSISIIEDGEEQSSRVKFYRPGLSMSSAANYPGYAVTGS